MGHAQAGLQDDLSLSAAHLATSDGREGAYRSEYQYTRLGIICQIKITLMVVVFHRPEEEARGIREMGATVSLCHRAGLGTSFCEKQLSLEDPPSNRSLGWTVYARADEAGMWAGESSWRGCRCR
jgi:hypothetical protein